MGKEPHQHCINLGGIGIHLVNPYWVNYPSLKALYRCMRVQYCRHLLPFSLEHFCLLCTLYCVDFSFISWCKIWQYLGNSWKLVLCQSEKWHGLSPGYACLGGPHETWYVWMFWPTTISQRSLFPELISYYIRVIAEVFSDGSLGVCGGVQTDLCPCGWEGVQKSLPCSPVQLISSVSRLDPCFLNCLLCWSWASFNFPLTFILSQVGRNIDRWLWMLSASRILTRAEGDCNVAQSKHGSIEADFEAWKAKFLSRLQALCRGEKKPCSGKCKKGKCKSPGKQSKESSDREHGASEYENAEVEPKSLRPCFWLSAPWSTIWLFPSSYSPERCCGSLMLLCEAEGEEGSDPIADNR